MAREPEARDRPGHVGQLGIEARAVHLQHLAVGVDLEDAARQLIDHVDQGWHEGIRVHPGAQGLDVEAR